MYGCEILFSVETAASVRAEVSKAMGGECPCAAGRTCPLLPADLGPLLDRRPAAVAVEDAASGVFNTREEPVARAEPASHTSTRIPAA